MNLIHEIGPTGLRSTLVGLSNKKKTVPVILFTKNCEAFSSIVNNEWCEFVTSSIFQIKKIDCTSDCIVLSPFIPIDIEGCPVDLCSDIYSLLPTKTCITLDLNCLGAVSCVPASLVDRYMPLYEPKY